MKFYPRTPFNLSNSLILVTTFISLLSFSGAQAADLKLFEGTWKGHWKRTSGTEKDTSGELNTVFTVKNNQLEGTHYGIEMKNIDVEGRVVTFEHEYKDCRAKHMFTVNLEDITRAKSEYKVVQCKNSENHDGEIEYEKQ